MRPEAVVSVIGLVKTHADDAGLGFAVYQLDDHVKFFSRLAGKDHQDGRRIVFVIGIDQILIRILSIEVL